MSEAQPDIDALVAEALVIPHEPEPPEHFRAYTLGEMLARPPKEYLVEGLFGPGDLCMIFGDSGTGKSFGVVDIAVRGALGLPIAGGFTVRKPLKTFYCVEEGLQGIPQRFAACCKHHGLEAGMPEFDFIRVSQCVPKLFYEDTNPEGVEALIYEVLALRAGGVEINVIIIDTFADAITGSDENANSDAGVVNRRMALIASRTGAAVIVVHHVTKATGLYRGASSYKAKMDLMIQFEGLENPRKITCFKSKDAEPFLPQAFNLVKAGEAVEDSAHISWEGTGGGSPKVLSKRDRQVQDIIRVLRERAPDEQRAMRVTQIGEGLQTGLTKGPLKDLLTELADSASCAVTAVKRRFEDAKGNQQPAAWHYYLDQSEEGEQ